MQPLPIHRALIATALGATCISFAAPFVKWAQMDPSAIGFYRCLFAAIALLPLVLRTDNRGGRWLGKGASIAFISGVVFAMDLIVWHKSILDVGAGVATLLANTQVFWVAIVSAGLLSEKLPRKFWFCGFVALLGVAALTLPGLASTKLSPTGVGFGLLAAVFYAGFILTLKASQKPDDALPLPHNLFLSSIGSTLTLGLAAIVENNGFTSDQPSTWAALIGLGVVVHVGGWMFISSGMPSLPTSLSSIMILFQPVMASIWGILFFGEAWGVIEAIGAGFTVTSIGLAARALASPSSTEESLEHAPAATSR